MRLEFTVKVQNLTAPESFFLERELKNFMAKQAIDLYSLDVQLIPEPPVDFHQSEPEE